MIFQPSGARSAKISADPRIPILVTKYPLNVNITKLRQCLITKSITGFDGEGMGMLCQVFLHLWSGVFNSQCYHLILWPIQDNWYILFLPVETMFKTLIVNCFQFFNNIFLTFQESEENKYYHLKFENTRWTDSLHTTHALHHFKR